MNKLLLVIVSAILLISGQTFAEVKLHGLFADNAVLQQGQPLPVWGTAEDGEAVTVTFAGETATTIAQEGRWQVELKPLSASATPRIMTVTGSNTTNPIELKNLLVGEVWLCSGQSNMVFTVGNRGGWRNGIVHRKEVIESAHDPQLRLFNVPYTPHHKKPQRDLARESSWRECTSETVGDFSAVAYFFGRDLREARGVPVGLITAAVGATNAERWVSREGLKAVGMEKSGKAPTSLYNGMIAPLQPLPIAGVIWYQGESNSKKAEAYRTLFPGLIADWRANWGQGDFPFLFVQIAPNGAMPPELREAQLMTWQKTANTAMVVITDHGGHIHPRVKEPVGARLALAARALAYDEKVEYSGPVFESLTVTGDQAELSFTHVGSGLVAKDGELKGFTLAGADKAFVPATARIDGDRVVVSSPEVPQPVAVRYGWANLPDVNLFNQAGLPATPFRSDVD